MADGEARRRDRQHRVDARAARRPSRSPAYIAAKAGAAAARPRRSRSNGPLHGIRVNAIAPGYVETDLNRDFLRSPAGEAMVKRVPMRRFGRPDDLDGALLLLASDAGRYMTGATLVVDGGHTLAWL